MEVTGESEKSRSGSVGDDQSKLSGEKMKMRLAALLTFAIGFVVPTFAQQAKDLVGTWTLVSITLEKDGKSTDAYGHNPMGQTTYGADGRFSTIIARSDLPKFVSNNRVEGTPEENKAVVQGSFADFGTYSVSETDKIITEHVESCTFPNFNGIERKLSFSISGDELHDATISGASGGGTAHAVWKRAGLAATAATTQEKSTVDPEVRQEIEAVNMKLFEARNKYDAAAAAAFYEQNAVQVWQWAESGRPAVGQKAIEERWHLEIAGANAAGVSECTAELVQMCAMGDEISAIWHFTCGPWNGYNVKIYVRDADTWKIRMEYEMSENRM
ncbi:MAG: lipocalin-like domain-containing protein [Verrucomicrobia bacterium]|nr:lipocalin-like domain-containing protein [Verrucomicrobiota bacterium]